MSSVKSVARQKGTRHLHSLEYATTTWTCLKSVLSLLRAHTHLFSCGYCGAVHVPVCILPCFLFVDVSTLL